MSTLTSFVSSLTVPGATDVPLTPDDSENGSSSWGNGSSSASTRSSSTPPTSTSAPTPLRKASYVSRYTSAPSVREPYSPKDALDDLPGVSYALQLFLESHMLESEEYCHRSDPRKERLYFATGFGLIQCVKGLMSFEDEDLLSAIEHTRHGNAIASQHRKPAASLTSRLANCIVGSLNTTGIGFVKTMSMVERHAELVYAESLFEKALLGIVYSGDWLAFIKEALNMRSTINIYRLLGKFLEVVDAEAQERGEGPEDKSIDAHFRSGVYLGVGMSNLILSLMPTKLLAIVELFGYRGDRRAGLELLAKAGGWTSDSDEPSVSTTEEGVRRSLCDMALLMFHLVLSSFTFDGVDLSMAQKVLEWNLKRYPDGIFFLFGAGRLSLVRSQPLSAIEFYTKATSAQAQYMNLHHISFWEIAIANISLWDIPSSLICWRDLHAEATWSKAIYSYGLAVCLIESGDVNERKEAAELMTKVPSLRQRIAGKSIPLEKFVARKARKFQKQGDRLTLPALEFGYFFLAIAHAPRQIISTKMLPEVERALSIVRTHDADPSKYEGGHGYWDDLCLAYFLLGVCLRYVAYPDPDAIIDPNERLALSREEAASRSVESFKLVFQNGPKIELDHHLVYHAHYELGRLLACQGDEEGARKHLQLVLSGKTLEVSPAGRKGKYSMENALHMRTEAALEALHLKRL